MTAVRLGSYPTPKVSFTQLDFEVVQAIHERYGGSWSVKGAANLVYLEWAGRSVARILEPILPYLVVKQQRACWMLLMLKHIGAPGVVAKDEDVQARYDYYTKIRNDDGSLDKYLTISPQWLAGFIEADGAITASGRNPAPQVEVVQKRKNILDEIMRRYGGNLQGPDTSDCFHLIWHGRIAGDLLDRIGMHLRFKHLQGQYALELSQLLNVRGTIVTDKQSSERRELSIKIKELNRHERNAATC